MKGWQDSWFYCKDVPITGGQSGLPPYLAERVRSSPALLVSKEEKTDMDILVMAVVTIINKGINTLDLLEVFLQRRIQSLQARVQPMWIYEGPSDSTRVHPEELNPKTVEAKIKSITSARDNPRGSRLVPPVNLEHPPVDVFQALISQMPVVNRESKDVASDTECQEASDKDDDDGEEESAEADDSKVGDEAESYPSENIPTECCSKTRHDPSAHARGSGIACSTALVPPTRTSKRTRGEAIEPPERATKQPKVSVVKPRKAALPRIKVQVLVALNADTSFASLDPKAPEKGQVEVDAVSSKGPHVVIELDGDDKIDPPNPSADENIVMRDASPPQVDRVSPAKALTPIWGATPRVGAALGAGTSATQPISPVTNIFTLHHVSKDQVGVGKEALI